MKWYNLMLNVRDRKNARLVLQKRTLVHFLLYSIHVFSLPTCDKKRDTHATSDRKVENVFENVKYTFKFLMPFGDIKRLITIL